MRDATLYLSKRTDSNLSKDVQIDRTYTRDLKPFQIEGIRFLFRKFLKEDGVILNDETDLGKTLQTVLFLSSIQLISSVKTLILSKEDNIDHWLFHFHKWSSYKAETHNHKAPPSTNFTIATLKDCEILAYTHWDIIVIDDLDPTKTVKHLSAVKPLFKIWLTSDNLSVKSKSLWKILNWITGNSVGTQKSFENTFFLNEDQLSKLWKSRQCLKNFCSRWLLRRTELSVSSQLPINTDEYHKCFSKWKSIQNGNIDTFDAKVSDKPLLSQFKSSNHLKTIRTIQQTNSKTQNENDESSPSLLDYVSFGGNIDGPHKRKGKDETGLKIKKSKLSDQSEVSCKLIPVDQSDFQCPDDKKNNNSETIDQNKIIKMENSDLNISLNSSTIITNPSAASIQLENDNDAFIIGNNSLQNDSKFHLLDSLFAGNSSKNVKIKSENHGNDSIIEQDNPCPTHEHSDSSIEKKQFKLLDDFFFRASKKP